MSSLESRDGLHASPNLRGRGAAESVRPLTYQMCSRCVMDTSDPEIVFDADGVCNHCKLHEERVALSPASKPDASAQLDEVLSRIKQSARGEYDCIIGLSGGVDSSYLAVQAVRLGLRPLAVHFDNGWNSELAVENIEKLVKGLGLDLMTYVIDWEEFRDIQRSFFKANVIDIEMVTDHAIFASMFKIAKKNGIRYILSGTNAATESIMPGTWSHFKFDLMNLRAIQSKFGTLRFVNFPTIGVWKMGLNYYVLGPKTVSPLNYMKFRKDLAIHLLSKEFDWRYYGGKHFESVFTKFYQAYILPRKFGVDKRRCHLSDLLMNGEITRDEALKELATAPLSDSESVELREYICKKLGFSDEEFESYMSAPEVSHFSYPSYAKLAARFVHLHRRKRYK